MNHNESGGQRTSLNNFQSETKVASREDANRFHKLHLFQAGAVQLGIFADEVTAIVEWREPTPLPRAPESVLGIVSIQGHMSTVLDVAALINHESASSGARVQHLIALRGDEQLALAIATLGETIEITEDDFQAKRDTDEPLVLGVLNREGTEISIINPKELFPTAIQGRERRRRRF
jgi:chemotaxis signal transduction protein